MPTIDIGGQCSKYHPPLTLFVCVSVNSEIAAVCNPTTSAAAAVGVASPLKMVASIPSTNAERKSRCKASSRPGPIRCTSSMLKIALTLFRFGFISVMPMVQAAAAAAPLLSSCVALAPAVVTGKLATPG